MTNEPKNAIRKNYLNARNLLTKEFVSEKSVEVSKLLMNSNILDEKNTIFVYYSISNEVETTKLIYDLKKMGKKIILPFMKRNNEGTLFLELAEFCDDSKLIKGPMGIMQPEKNEGAIDATTIDIAIIPGVAFDNRGNRIGYGKGFYDRVLPNFNNDCPKIALAFEMQIISEIIEYAEYDMKMDYIITEKRIMEINL